MKKLKLKKMKLGKTPKTILKFILENGLNVLAVLVYGIYLLIQTFNNMIAKVFLKMPRYAKVVTIYFLVIMTLISTMNFGKTLKIEKIQKDTEVTEELSMVIEETEKVEEIPTELEEVEKTEKIETSKETKKVEKTTKKENKTSCKWSEVECAIYNKSIEYGMTQAQAYITMAISRHETGNWTSNAYLTKNNFGGMMTSKGLRVFETNEEGLDAFVKLLKNNYFDKGYRTIEQIQKRYAPIGAENDPNNLNSNWLKGVINFYYEYAN